MINFAYAEEDNKNQQHQNKAVDNLTLGIIETRQAGWPTDQNDTNEVFSLARILFQYINNTWINVDPNATPVKNFNIIFDMKNIGKVTLSEKIQYNTGYGWGNNCYTLKETPPKIGKYDFFFSSSWAGGRCYRPLVILSEDNHNDPMKWKPVSFPEMYYKNIVKLHYDRLKKLHEEYKDDRHNPVDIIYNYEQIISRKLAITHKSYKNKENGLLLHIEFPDEKLVKIEPALYDQLHGWYYVKNNEIKYIGSYLKLIDAADFDLDNTSDVIFCFTGYNKDGYILYYNNLNNKVEYYWTYH